MHSALIQITRSYAACHMTTAHQRRPSLVPLVLQARYTQTTTHLVDIIQTVSRNLKQSLLFCFEMYYTFILFLVKRRSAFSSVIKTELQHFRAKSLQG